MWFDVTAALAEIEGGQERAPRDCTPATSATSATKAPDARPVSRLSQVSQPPEAENPHCVAIVAVVATPPARLGGLLAKEAAPDAVEPLTAHSRYQPAQPKAPPDAFRHGVSVAGTPLTWTGRVVSLAEWRSLSEWQRHGPNGRLWCGIARDWIKAKG
jgi:hypothetical protein